MNTKSIKQIKFDISTSSCHRFQHIFFSISRVNEMARSVDNIWTNFPGCECLKVILVCSGYDNLPSLKCINSDLLIELENHVEENRWMMQNMNCNHKLVYEKQNKYGFLPGHRALLLEWCLFNIMYI